MSTRMTRRSMLGGLMTTGALAAMPEPAAASAGGGGSITAIPPLTYNGGVLSLDPTMALAAGNMRAPNPRGVPSSGMVINKWDTVVYKGRRILYTGTNPTTYDGYISAANYIELGPPPSRFYASDFGCNADGSQSSAGANTTAIQTALNAANPTGGNAIGGVVELPPGNSYVNATLDIPNGVHLVGNGTFGTYLSLADSANCTMLKPHTSTASGNPNAFYWSIRDLSLDCRAVHQGVVITDTAINAGSTAITSATRNWVDGEIVSGSGIPPGTTIASGGGTLNGTLSQPATQTLNPATVYAGLSSPIYGIHARTNPLNSQQAGDWGFDPTGLIFNVAVKNARNAGVCIEGRSDIAHVRVKVTGSMEIGFISSFDTTYDSCLADFAGWHGFDIRGSSTRLIGCKSYNSGQGVKTTALASFNEGHGFKVTGFMGMGEVSFAGCDAQQNTGNGFDLNTCSNVCIGGCTVADVGYTGATPVATALGLRLNAVSNSVVSLSVKGLTGNSGLALVAGSDKNSIILAHSGSGIGPGLAAGSAVLTNKVEINGTSINSPNLVSSATVAVAKPTVYARRGTTAGAFYTSGVPAPAVAHVLNRAEFVPVYLDHNGMSVKTIYFRPGTAVPTAIMRVGLYTSSWSGTDDFMLLAELPSQFDCSTTGVKSIDFAGPVAVPDDVILWVCAVPQVALTSSFQSGTGNLVAGANALGGNYAFTLGNVTGALPATVSWGSSGSPVSTGNGILTTLVLLG